MTTDTLSIYCDGGSRGNPGPAASAFYATLGDMVLAKEYKYLGVATNNFAEYSAVLMASNWLKANAKANFSEVVFFLDSQLIVKQMTGEYKIKSVELIKIYSQIVKLHGEIDSKIVFKHVPRELNKMADYLVNVALDNR